MIAVILSFRNVGEAPEQTAWPRSPAGWCRGLRINSGVQVSKVQTRQPQKQQPLTSAALNSASTSLRSSKCRNYATKPAQWQTKSASRNPLRHSRAFREARRDVPAFPAFNTAPAASDTSETACGGSGGTDMHQFHPGGRGNGASRRSANGKSRRAWSHSPYSPCKPRTKSTISAMRGSSSVAPTRQQRSRIIARSKRA